MAVTPPPALALSACPTLRQRPRCGWTRMMRRRRHRAALGAAPLRCGKTAPVMLAQPGDNYSSLVRAGTRAAVL